ATRHYGRLMAQSPGGAFFAHEREMLDVYARYAATVLDTATALDEARSREEQSRALLELSRAVAAASTSDEVARRLADVVPALVVVPIVAHDHFYGSLHVSVTERAERLQPTPALLDLLEGVVAQTATALDNARLIETMAHQARFDNLTGLLGHRAFHEALEIQ